MLNRKVHTMQKVTKQVFLSNPLYIQYLYPQVTYNYLLANNVNNMSQKQFNKSFAKCVQQFNKYSRQQKAQIFNYTKYLSSYIDENYDKFAFVCNMQF